MHLVERTKHWNETLKILQSFAKRLPAKVFEMCFLGVCFNLVCQIPPRGARVVLFADACRSVDMTNASLRDTWIPLDEALISLSPKCPPPALLIHVIGEGGLRDIVIERS